MGALDGKVAFITGAARGQGRSHALKLAEEGCDIIAVDLCEQLPSVTVPMSTRKDLDETVSQVEALGRRIVWSIADVRDQAQLIKAASDGVAELGRIDIVLANAGIWAVALDEPVDVDRRQEVWRDTIDINLTGVWNTVEATAPHIISGGRGGAIVLTSSTVGLASAANNDISLTSYVAAKHGVIGIMRNYAVDLAPHWIRVNAVAPTAVNTPMSHHPLVEQYGAKHPVLGEVMGNLLDVGAVEPIDISNAIFFLVSDAARYITGTVLPVDAGHLVK